MGRKHWILIGAIFMLALALRLYGLGSREIWYDEAFSYFLAQQNPADIVIGTAADTEPPLYYLLLHGWLRLGSTESTLRLLGVLFSMVTLLIVFDLARRLVGMEAALWASLFTAVAPFQIYHAQEMRMYGLLALTQAAYFWFFVRLEESGENKNRPGFWAGLVISGTAAIYSQSLAIFGLLIPNFYLILKRQWRDLRNLILAQGVILVLTIPWLIHVPAQIQKIQTAFYTPVPGLLEVFQSVVQAHAFLPLEGLTLWITAILSLQCVVIVGWESVRVRSREDVQFLVLIWLGIPAMLFIVSYLMRPIFVPRAFIVSMLAYLILAGAITAKKWNKGIGPLIVAVFVVLTLISLPAYYTFKEFPRSPFRAATNYLEENAHGELILHDNKLSYFPVHFYAPELEQEFLPDAAGSHNDTYALASQQAMKLFPVENMEKAVNDEDSVWFIVFTKAIEEYREMGEPTHPVIADLNRFYKLEQHKVFGDLEIYSFRR